MFPRTWFRCVVTVDDQSTRCRSLVREYYMRVGEGAVWRGWVAVLIEELVPQKEPAIKLSDL